MFAFPLDQMVGGIFYEHSHRMIASFVGFLTIILAIWIWKRDDRKWMRVLGFVALGAVITQGLLGGLTVLFMLPTAISVSHATLAQSFFALVCAIALFTSRWWKTESVAIRLEEQDRPLMTLALVTTFAVFIQLILGALMRHTQSGLAVPDFPLAYGQIFPSLSSDALTRYNEQLIRSEVRLAADGPINQMQIIIHMIHRFWAIVVGGMILWIFVRMRKLDQAPSRLKKLSWTLLTLLLVQIGLGAVTVLSQKAVDITTAHVASGALLLATCVVMTFSCVKLFGVRFHESAVAFSPKGATA